VGEASGNAYRDRLLPLPAFLASGRAASSRQTISLSEQFRDGLKLTGFFIHRDIFEAKGIKPVAARDRLVSHVWRADIGEEK